MLQYFFAIIEIQTFQFDTAPSSSSFSSRHPIKRDEIISAYPLPAACRYSILSHHCSRLIHLDFYSNSCRPGSNSNMNYCSSTLSRSRGDSNGYPVPLSFLCPSHSAGSDLHWSLSRWMLHYIRFPCEACL
jgi:hypothetical protein